MIRYLCDILYYGLSYTKDQLGFVGYPDANLSDGIDERQSTVR